VVVIEASRYDWLLHAGAPRPISRSRKNLERHDRIATGGDTEEMGFNCRMERKGSGDRIGFSITCGCLPGGRNELSACR